MKAFNKESMMQYVATLSIERGEHYSSPQDMAQDFVEGFEEWLATKDLPKIDLPVKAEGCNVVDSSGALVAGCGNELMAQALVAQLNADWQAPDDSEDEGLRDPSELSLQRRAARPKTPLATQGRLATKGYPAKRGAK